MHLLLLLLVHSAASLLLQRRVYELKSLYRFPSYANGDNKRYKWQHCRSCFQSVVPAGRKGISHHAHLGGVGKVWEGLWATVDDSLFGNIMAPCKAVDELCICGTLAIPCLLSTAWNFNGDTERSQWDYRKHPWPRQHVCQSMWFLLCAGCILLSLCCCGCV